MSDATETVEFRVPGNAAQAIAIDEKRGDAEPGVDYTYTQRKRGRGYTYLVEATPDAARELRTRFRERQSSWWDQPSNWSAACKIAEQRVADAIRERVS